MGKNKENVTYVPWQSDKRVDLMKEAVVEEDKSVVSNLLKQNANINSKDNEMGNTPLMHALEASKSLDFIKFLLENNADPFEQNNYRKNALHLCAQNGWNDIMDALLENSDLDPEKLVT